MLITKFLGFFSLLKTRDTQYTVFKKYRRRRTIITHGVTLLWFRNKLSNFSKIAIL